MRSLYLKSYYIGICFDTAALQAPTALTALTYFPISKARVHAKPTYLSFNYRSHNVIQMKISRMLPPQSLHLHSALTSLKAQSKVLAPCCTTSKPIQQRFFRSSTRPSSTTSPLHTQQPHHLKQLTRFESTTASTPLSPSTSSASPSRDPNSPSPSTLHPLTWNAYLSLRKTRRRYNLASSVFTSLCTTTGAMSVLSELNLERINIFGLDPILILGLSTVGSGGLGWLFGPFIGNAVFRLVHRRVGPQIAEVSVFCVGLSCSF